MTRNFLRVLGGCAFALWLCIPMQASRDRHLRQAILFGPIADQDALATIALTATASSGLPVTISSSTPAVCTVDGDTASMVMSGRCALVATQAGNDEYSPATATARFTVRRITQTVTFGAIAAQYVANPLALAASASSGLPISYASATPSVCTVAGDTASPIAPGTCTVSASQDGNGVYLPSPTESQSFTVNPLAGHIIGDSINYCEGATSTASCASYNILEDLGVSVANISRYARGGAAMEEIANQQLNDAVVTPGTITLTDGCQNCNQMNLHPAEFETEQQAMVAALVDATVIDPSLAIGLPQKQFATSAALTGTAATSTDYPAKGETCTSSTCMFVWNNVPGPNIYIFVEVTTAGSYNPVVSVDGTECTGNWSTGSALLGYLEPTNMISYGPWPIQIVLPAGANGLSGLHKVSITVPSGQTVIQVVGVGNANPPGGPWIIAESQFVWYDDTNTERAVGNNVAWTDAIQEVQQSGLNAVYVNLEPYINGYTALGATITGASTRPDLAFAVTNGSLSGIGFVPVSIGIGGGGGVCASNPTIAFFGGGPEATLPTATLTCSGGTVTGATIDSAGSNITLPQLFDTQTLHPNDAGQAVITRTTLNQVGILVP